MDTTTSMIGKTWYCDEGDPVYQRDAIHIAVAPVVAAEELQPGTLIKFKNKDDHQQVVAAKPAEAVGIVDPYLREKVWKDRGFWMFLFPGTVTSLRHEWMHPAFAAIGVEAAQAWIRDFASTIESDYYGGKLDYDRLMAAAAEYAKTGDMDCLGSEDHQDVPSAKWEVFWAHFQTITGAKGASGTPFVCAC